EDSPSEDIFIVPLSSRTINLLPGEFILHYWQASGLNVKTSVKRGIFTINEKLVIQLIGILKPFDIMKLNESILEWLGINK
ncbi:MAG: mRNA interferase MazF, partial [Bacteroidota bacterium]|nr:mRNA interferase MazF [Bacteroidota bacterium]